MIGYSSTCFRVEVVVTIEFRFDDSTARCTRISRWFFLLRTKHFIFCEKTSNWANWPGIIKVIEFTIYFLKTKKFVTIFISIVPLRTYLMEAFFSDCGSSNFIIERSRTVRSKSSSTGLSIFVERIGYTINSLRIRKWFSIFIIIEETIISMNKLVTWDFLLFTGILIIVVAVFNHVFELCSEVVVKVDRDTINGMSTF